MELSGTIKGGVVVLDSPTPPPDGTRVKVEIIDSEENPGEWVKDYSGCVEDMPEDASLNYHHTLYGALKELRVGLPFLDIAIAGPKRFERYVTRLFAADRHGVPKGMVEVLFDAPE